MYISASQTLSLAMSRSRADQIGCGNYCVTLTRGVMFAFCSYGVKTPMRSRDGDQPPVQSGRPMFRHPRRQVEADRLRPGWERLEAGIRAPDGEVTPVRPIGPPGVP